MIGILLVSHGGFAAGLKDSLQLIVGDFEKVDTASLVAGEDFEVFRKEVYQKIEALDDGDGVLVFVDLFGASPYNAAQYAAMERGKEKVGVISGMNLPMVLDGVLSRDQYVLNDLVDSLIETGKDGIAKPTVIIADDEDGDY